MKRIHLTATSRLNIALHLLTMIGFSYFVYVAGDSFFGGLLASIVIVIGIDTVACIKARRRDKV